MKKLLHLGCGQQKMKGAIGMDTDKAKGVDHLLSGAWPFKDGIFDEVYATHIVNRLPDLLTFMEELYRIMKKGARCMVIAPYYTSIRATLDPRNCRPISEATFSFFNAGFRKANRLDHLPIKCNFDFSFGHIVDPEWERKSMDAQQQALKNFWNVALDIQITLTKL